MLKILKTAPLLAKVMPAPFQTTLWQQQFSFLRIFICFLMDLLASQIVPVDTEGGAL